MEKKEHQMFRKRFFNVSVSIALISVAAFTVQGAFATASLLSRPYASKGTKTLMCASLPSRHSLRTEYVEELGMWVSSTEEEPTGVEGGLIQLLSNYRTCSR
jgi:hypothetical protein